MYEFDVSASKILPVLQKVNQFIINESSQIGELRRIATKLATDGDFSENDIAKIAIIVTEAATNLLKYATSGRQIIIRTQQTTHKRTFDLLAVDKGPGINNINICLGDGFSTSGSPGTGLGAIRRLTNEFDIYSQLEQGTVLWAQLTNNIPKMAVSSHLPTAITPPFNIGSVALPIRDEKVSGDNWSVYYSPAQPNIALFMLVDGLGHGIDAYTAANKAVELFQQCGHLDLLEILEELHRGLKKTRGAAIAIAKIDKTTQQLEYAGIGNISGVIVSPAINEEIKQEKKQSLTSYNGIIGYQLNKIKKFSYSFPAGSILIMHSDGLMSRWLTQSHPKLFSHHPNVIAGALYRDYNRNTDDITVLVVK